jgi:hypothetical protein
MNYSKKEIGVMLKNELNKGYDIKRISNWAEDIFFNIPEGSIEHDNILRHLLLMDAGPEFEYSEEELKLLAEMLINEEEDPIKKINEFKSKKD